MPHLTRLTITLPGSDEHQADILALVLARHAAHGWEEQALPGGGLCLTVHFTLPEACAELEAALRAEVPEALLARDLVEESDWVEAWKEFFTPVEAGRHFLVLAPWMEQERRETSRLPIIIEPKTAFGTGHHASTALCLTALSQLYSEDRLAPGMRYLDLGTGTGILAIGCAKLGLGGDALDIDPIAVDNALENRALNGIEPELLRAARGGLEAALGPYDLVLANILAGPLIDMAPEMAAFAAPGGGLPLLVLSGILTSQADAVAAAYTAQGFALPRRLEREEWTALIFA